jgi:uncharacterized membrane protein
MAKEKMKMETIGQWSFIVGVVIAVLFGIFGTAYAGWVGLVLIVLGILVGLLNISDKEVYDFLIAAIALMLTGAAGLDRLPMVGAYLGPIFLNISTFVAPAAIICALKAVYELGKEK